ncbi:MAG: response regulator [Chitinophagales bacterium]
MPSHPSDKKPVAGIGSKLILIGEDDLDDQEFLKEIFLSVDDSFSLIFASNGPEVLSVLEKIEDTQLPCLVVLDYNMPGSNGAEILQVLKDNSRYDSIPKIIWSTSRSDMYKDICLEMGANDYLVKPSSVSELVEICRYMISTCIV